MKKFILLLFFLVSNCIASSAMASSLGQFLEQPMCKNTILPEIFITKGAEKSVFRDGLKQYGVELSVNVVGGSTQCTDAYGKTHIRNIFSVWESSVGKFEYLIHPGDDFSDLKVLWVAPENTNTSIIKVAIGDSLGSVVRNSISIVPKSLMPSLSIDYFGDNYINSSLSFDVSTFDWDIFTYKWSFGDGATADGASATHAYNSQGTYTVKVTATDAQNNQITAEKTIQILPKDTPKGILTINASSSVIQEGSTASLIVGFDQVADVARIVSLSADSSDVTYPATVTVPAGAKVASPVTITAKDDSLKNGNRVVKITATSQYAAASQSLSLTIQDNETTSIQEAKLGLSLSSRHIIEGTTTADLIVYFDQPSDKNRYVIVTSSESKLYRGGFFSFPLRLTIPAGSTQSLPQNIGFSANQIFEAGVRTATLTASSVDAYNIATASLDIEEADKQENGLSLISTGSTVINIAPSGYTNFDLDLWVGNETLISKRITVKLIKESRQYNLLVDQEYSCSVWVDSKDVEKCTLKLRLDEDAESGKHSFNIQASAGENTFKAYQVVTVVNNNVPDVVAINNMKSSVEKSIGSLFYYSDLIIRASGNGHKPSRIPYTVWLENTTTKNKRAVSTGFADTTNSTDVHLSGEFLVNELGSFNLWLETSPYLIDKNPENNISSATLISVVLADTDGDGYPDDQDAFPNDPKEWLDTNGNGIGNNADPDDDGDGMLDTWEQQYSFDQLNSADAGTDADSDGFTNKQEHDANTHPRDAKSYPVKAKVSTVIPETANVGEKITVIVTGTDLPDTLDMQLADCAGIQKLAGATATEVQFSCTFSGAGTKSGTIKDKAGSNYTLKTFSVNVSEVLPDLRPVNLQIPASVKAGTSINVSVDIENIGGTATPAFSLGVWLSEDDVLSGNEALPPVPIPAVLTSTSANVSFDVYIPEHITSNYRLFVKADAAQVVTESNEDNNQITANLVMEEITAKVYSVEPLVADVNENTVFTVKGIKLPNTLAFWIGYCEGLTKLPNATETRVQFSCTPSRAEKLQGLVKDKSGGSLLMEFFVEASVLDKDQDGIKDTLDNCPEIKNTDQKDLDRDKIGDVCDTDRDGDSVSNDQDAFPDDKAESKDNDKDGIGNNADPDDDNDGMSDTWEEQHGFDSLNPADATQDADKDSFTNKQEYDAGTDPKNAKSYPMTATISSVIPNTAIVGKRLELVITGKNLTGSIDVTLLGCDDMQIRTDGVYPQLSPKSVLKTAEAPPSSPPLPPSGTLPPLPGVNDLVNQFIASCMPTVAGLKTGVIRDKAGSDYILKQFEVTVANVDTTPEPFPFTHQTGVALSALITSNEITVSGINTATAIAVTSGKYSINGDTYISIAGTVNNGDKVKVQHTSSASYSSKTDTTLAIGGVSSTFSSTTKANSPPTANVGNATTDEDNAVDIHLSGSDADGDTIAYIATQPANGMVSVLGDKATYTPKINWNGTDSFTFTVSDGRSSSAAATVTVKVNPVNDAPTASTVAATTNENKAVEITLIGTDVDGDIISYLVTQPANGTVSVLQNKAIYTPKANWSGTDSFTFMTSDGKLTSAATTVSLIVKAVNHAPTQQVSIRTCTRVAAGELVTCQVQYTTSDNEAKLGGLGLRIHHDSTKLTFVGVDNVLSKGLLSYDTEPFSDVENNDQDAHTDQHTRFAWVDMAAEWPNTTSLPTNLLTIRFRLNEDLKVGDTTTLRFTESETAEGYVFSSEPYVLAVANACTLDVDGNGQVRALTDGLLALRYMFNFKGVTLTNKVVAADATRKTALEIEPYLEQCKASFDIDGNSQIKALTDGLLILRYEFNFRGTKLTDKAVASDATRKTAEDIEPYLQRLYP